MSHLLDAQLLIQKGQLQPGMHVADFGCGRTGHIVFPAALVVGSEGVVFAIDIMKDVLENIRKRADMEALTNIHPVWSDVERVGKTAIPEKSLDVIFLINTLSHGAQSFSALDEADRLLREKGRIVIVDWQKAPPGLGPQAGSLLNFALVKEWAGSHNFLVQEEFQAGAYHWGIILFRQS